MNNLVGNMQTVMVGKNQKLYTMEKQKGLLNAFDPMTLAITTAKTVVKVMATALQGSPEVADSKKEVSKEIGIEILRGIGQEMLYQTTCSTLQLLSVKLLKPSFSAKLMKDVAKSSMRKTVRGVRGERLAMSVFPSAALSSLFSHLSIFLVEQVVLFVGYWRSPDRKTQAQDILLRHTYNNALICMKGVIFTGLGSVIGTFASPGRGTYIGGLVGGLIPYM